MDTISFDRNTFTIDANTSDTKDEVSIKTRDTLPLKI